MSDRVQNCERRIAAELNKTEQHFAALWQRLDSARSCIDWERSEAVYEELEPLSIEIRPVLTVQLSWGGPSDWLEIELDNTSAHDVERVTYHYADWFDHAERDVPQHKAAALWRAAAYYAEQAGYLLAAYRQGDA
jgi:hypothetical protein